MRAIYFKEIKSFLGALSGYVVMLAFVCLSGLLLWVLPDGSFFNTNILDYGYASLVRYFLLAPWLLIFLIPAVTMRSFSEEFAVGTIEWLGTQPLTLSQIIAGKFLAALSIVGIALIPTLIYIVSVYWLAMADAALDFGVLAGAYFGLLLLAAAFTAVGCFASTLTDNQIVSFLMAAIICFILYFGFEAISRIPAFRGGADYYLEKLGMDYHYNYLNNGRLDSRSVLYFLSVIFLFLATTRFSLQRRFLK